MRRIAAYSRDFWERFAPYASQTMLARRFPASSGGYSLTGWQSLIRTAKSAYPDLPWLKGRRGHLPEFPPEWLELEPVYEDELPVEDITCPAEDSPLSTEEQVERDRTIRRLKEQRDEAKRKYETALRESEVEDRIVEALEARVAALTPVSAPKLAKRSGGRPETVVALVSDYHIGEVVSAEETGGLAVYDWETFTRRWQYHVDSIGGICFGKLTGYDLPRLVIPMLGDMVTGIIHEELAETAEATPMEWVVDGGHLIAQGIRQLASEFESIEVDCVIGNHGRLQKQVRYKKRYVNWDYLLYKFMELELRDQPNVSIKVNKSFYSLHEVANNTLLNLHGDNIRSWGGLPWYGIQRAVTNFSALLRTQRRGFDLLNLGHFHNAGTLDRIDCELVLNGSAVGGNEYSIGALFTSNKPKQVMYGVHPERGKTWEYKIDLSHGDAHECRM